MKTEMKPGNMLYPLPVVLVSVHDGQGHDNLLTIGWAGTVCSDPPMVSISVRKERYSYDMIEKTKEFVVNVTTEETAFATDLCGVKSGRDMDKWKAAGLTRGKAVKVGAPVVAECPVNIECRVTQALELGTHVMFLGEVVAVQAGKEWFDENGRFMLEKTRPIAYCHGEYYGLGKKLGTYGYSVRKKK